MRGGDGVESSEAIRDANGIEALASLARADNLHLRSYALKTLCKLTTHITSNVASRGGVDVPWMCLSEGPLDGAAHVALSLTMPRR